MATEQGSGEREREREESRYAGLMRFALCPHHATHGLKSESAAEMAHEAIVAHFYANRRGETIANDEAYVISTLHNIVVVEQRRRARSAFESLDLAAGVAATPLPIDEADLDRVREMLPRLLARWLEGFLTLASDSELARKDTVSVQAIRKRRERLHGWLRENLL